MKLTVLMENTGPEGLVHEHGLALYIRYGGHTLLLDGGATGRAVQNADALGLDLGAAEAVVLSHGHYDHGDGLPALLERTAAPVYLRPRALAPHYHGDAGTGRYIGLSPETREALAGRTRPVEGVTELFSGVWLVPDRVDHEQSLVLECRDGLVVCNSCCHAGAGYIVRDLGDLFPSKKVLALVGGLHLMGAGGTRTLGVAPGIVKNLGKWLLEELDVGTLYTGHCTGAPAFDLLREDHPDRVVHITTGLSLEFPEADR